MLDINNLFMGLPLVQTKEEILGENFFNAGFDNTSLVLGTADCIFIIVMTSIGFFLTKIFYIISVKIIRSKRGARVFSSQISNFGLSNYIELFFATYLVVFMCACINV